MLLKRPCDRENLADHGHCHACEQVMAVKGYDGLRAMVEAANLSLDTFMPEVGGSPDHPPLSSLVFMLQRGPGSL